MRSLADKAAPVQSLSSCEVRGKQGSPSAVLGRGKESRCGQLSSDIDSAGSRLNKRASHCLAEGDRSMPCASLRDIHQYVCAPQA